jgi:hypothetical protein
MSHKASDFLTLTDQKYSHNFREWLRKQSRRGRSLEGYEVVRSTGELKRRYIGFRLDDGAFIGSALNTVLAQGGRAETGCWVGSRDWNPIRRFWDDYYRIGVCATDTDHYFYSERWDTNNRKRICKYCGKVQVLRKKRKVVLSEVWENLA